MDWTAGYASDVEYTAGFYREQGPGYLNFVSVLNGCEPVDTSRPYTYFELGFGRGLTVNLLAASNPLGQFHAADFNPAHVADARHLASTAQLPNVFLYENSFAELAEGAVADLPQFDFITLHGIYTWVTGENRRHIVNFINRYLKPGGIVYVSYNAMPGWSASLPLQRLLVEHAGLFPNRSDAQVKGASAFVAKLNQTKAGYFAGNTALQGRLETLATGNANYLVHEYMHKHWQPLYHADVARDLADAKLDYVGLADLPAAYESLYFAPEQLEIINSLPDATLRETVKDYYLNTTFRKDVYVRGARRTNPMRRAELLSRFGLALLVPRDQVKLTITLHGRDLAALPEHYNPVLDAIERQPKTIADLIAIPELAAQTFHNLAQIIALLTASGQAFVYERSVAKPAAEAALRMNRALAEVSRASDEYQALCSPVLGSAISANFLERLVYLALMHKAPEGSIPGLAVAVWKIMRSQNRQMLKGGTVLQTEEENLTELREQIGKIIEGRLPLWRQLRMI